MNFVDHLLFYMKLLNYLFSDMFGSVLECYELTHISWLSTPRTHAWVNRHCYPIGCVIKSTNQGICSCSPIVNFFEFTFHHGMATSVIFLIKKIIYIDTLNMKICWVFMKIWIIFKQCCSLWHVQIPENIATIYYKISLCVFQYQYCGYIAKTRLHSWKIIQIFS